MVLKYIGDKEKFKNYVCIKASRFNRDDIKKLTKDNLKELLKDHGINIYNKKNGVSTLKSYNEMCNELVKINILVEEKIKDEETKKCLNKDISYADLKEKAKKNFLNYKGTREELCQRLKNIGYVFDDDEDIIDVNSIKCYNLKKKECEENVDNCTWLPQLITRESQKKTEKRDKKLMIDRLNILDKLNDKKLQNYSTWTIDNLKKKLSEEYGLAKMGSSCIKKSRTKKI